jgi:DNA-binding FadR family transcriptional regulator
MSGVSQREGVRSRGAALKTLPNRVAEHFLARIFTGDLPAGTKLPPDRELAAELGVDRTSLRMAMQQLSRMGLVRAVRGSGVHVLDYREHAGLDFLAAIFALPDVSLGGAFLLQALDDWLDVMPVIIGRALARATRDDLLALDAILETQLELLARGRPLHEVVTLEIALQDAIVRRLGNTALLLLGNSSRPLRQRLVALYFADTDVVSHVETQRQFLMQTMQAPAEPQRIAERQRAYLRERTEPLRQRLQRLPLSPTLVPRRQRKL